MNETDPRVRRTRKLLHDALVELLQEKGFHAISVQDIADRSTVNRATFYAHFEDKYALLDYVVGERFRDELRRAGLDAAAFDEANLRKLVATVLHFVRSFHSGCRPADRDLQPMLETRMQSELASFLGSWLGEQSTGSRQAAAKVAGWAIFGSAIDWSRGDTTETLDARSDEVLDFLLNGLGVLTFTDRAVALA